MPDAQHSARALLEAGALDAFVTSFAYREEGFLASCLNRLPIDIAERMKRQLMRRNIDQVPARFVHSYPMWEILRSGAAKCGAGPIVVDAIWDRMSRSFDSLVAKRYVPRTQAIAAFEYTAFAAFARAEREGVAKILHLPSPDSRHFETILRSELGNRGELTGEPDEYFADKFAERYERRRMEVSMADVVIANSTLTAKTHIKAGANPAKLFTVPLAAPPPISEIRVASDRTRALKAIWAGQFSLRKGAHHLLDAWKLLNRKTWIELHVYGSCDLPDRVLASSRGEGIVFHGSVPRSQLFEAYEASDVLVFPTLCDGFGMVVTEALAHGLPIITTDQAGAADLINADNGLLIPAADAKALVEALNWCLDNRERLREMRFHALATAQKRQWSDFRRDLIAALDQGLRHAGYCPAFEQLG